MWDSITLYEIDTEDGVNELADFEPVLAASADGSEHTEVKARLADDLRNRLRHIDEKGKDVYGEDFDILDNIANPSVLKVPAVYAALEMIFRGKSVSHLDTFAKKAEMYGDLYPKALDSAARRLNWTVDMAKRRTGRITITR